MKLSSSRYFLFPLETDNFSADLVQNSVCLRYCRCDDITGCLKLQRAGWYWSEVSICSNHFSTHVNHSIYHVRQHRSRAHDDIFYAIQLLSVIAVFVCLSDTVINWFRLCVRERSRNVEPIFLFQVQTVGLIAHQITHVEEVRGLLMEIVVDWLDCWSISFALLFGVVNVFGIVEWNQIWCLQNRRIHKLLRFYFLQISDNFLHPPFVCYDFKLSHIAVVIV